MAQYINKSALVAEIENLENTYKEYPTRNSYEEGLKDGRLIGYKDALHKIDTLEVKEVDLEKEYDNEFFKDPVFGKLVNRNAGISIAKHFFELGLKAQEKIKL